MTIQDAKQSLRDRLTQQSLLNAGVGLTFVYGEECLLVYVHTEEEASKVPRYWQGYPVQVSILSDTTLQ